MIKQTFYKDRPAIEIGCAEFSAVFLPEDGAKLASFKTKNGFELLAQREGAKYLRLDLEGNYEHAECSGFDDMFPAIDPCTVCGMEYLDHGEVCRRAHLVQIEGEKVHFSCNLPSLHVTFRKTVFAEGGALFMKYSIENHGDADFPYVWAGHIMFRGEEGMYATSSFPENAPKTIMYGTTEREEILHILPKKGPREYKFYYKNACTPLQTGVVYPESGVTANITFDNDIVRYLGLWVNPGDLNGMYNLALEPCTALYDNPVNAEAAGAASYIKAHDTVTFTMQFTCEVRGM